VKYANIWRLMEIDLNRWRGLPNSVHNLQIGHQIVSNFVLWVANYQLNIEKLGTLSDLEKPKWKEKETISHLQVVCNNNNWVTYQSAFVRKTKKKIKNCPTFLANDKNFKWLFSWSDQWFNYRLLNFKFIINWYNKRHLNKTLLKSFFYLNITCGE